jgi:hypothetical protein
MNSKRFFPVIHCVDPYEQQGIGHALHNTRIAEESGADGVFLIGHSMAYRSLCEIYEHVRKQFPDMWIGVNFLDVSSYRDWPLLSDIARLLHVNGLWIDTLPDKRLDVPSSTEVFGGVAFKYIDPSIRGAQLKESCDKALHVVDVITTSGTKTGSAPDVQKLEEIRENIGNDAQLALASGVTEKNISLFLPIVDTFLVASSIIERREDLGNHEYLIPEKVEAMARKIHL